MPLHIEPGSQVLAVQRLPDLFDHIADFFPMAEKLFR